MASKSEIVDGTNRVIGMFNFRVTLRQVFYRLVEDLRILKKTQNEYKRLSAVLVEARLAGLVDIDAFADLGRGLASDVLVYSSPEAHYRSWHHAFETCGDHYSVPRWHGQPRYVEVWVEKAAMQGFFQQVTDPAGVPLFPTRGYPSLTSLKEAADRIRSVVDEGNDREIVVLYFGDHDPSGQDITRYVRERMLDDFEIDMAVKRVVINREHIGRYSLPTAPPKHSDSRTAGFRAEHGSETVELEAFRPDVLMSVVSTSIEELFDSGIRREMVEREREGQSQIRRQVREALVGPDDEEG